MDDIGLEFTSKTRGKQVFNPKATPNPTPSNQLVLKGSAIDEVKVPDDPRLEFIFLQWTHLPSNIQEKVVALIDAASQCKGTKDES